MYDKMRAEILRELSAAGIDPAAVIPCIDKVAVRYNVAEREGSTMVYAKASGDAVQASHRKYVV